MTARELAESRYNQVIAQDLTGLGMSYNLFTRTTTLNHRAVTPETLHRALQQRLHLRQGRARRDLPVDRPHPARPLGHLPDLRLQFPRPTSATTADQLDPVDLINPRRRSTARPSSSSSTLPAFADVLGTYLRAGQWRPTCSSSR